MKQILLALSLLLLTILPAGAVKKINAHPLNVAIALVEKTDSTKITSTLEYYGYTLKEIENGYKTMRDSEGNEIQYSFEEIYSTNRHPIIRVNIKETRKAIDSRLKELNFEKTGNSYEYMRNKYSKYKTRCSYGPHGTIMVQRIKN